MIGIISIRGALFARKNVWRKTEMEIPFAYNEFLGIHREFFEPRVNQLGNFCVRAGGNVIYDEILSNTPPTLWRISATALWLEKPKPEDGPY